MDDPEVRVRHLQEQIRHEHERLKDLPHANPEFDVTANKIMDLTRDLLDLEDRLPVLLDEANRQMSLVTVRIAGAVAAFAAGCLTVLSLMGWIGVNPWWSFFLVPLAIIGVATAFTRVRPAGERHREQRNGSCLIGAGTIVLVTVVLGIAPTWLALVGALLEFAGLFIVFGRPTRTLSIPDSTG
jgi:hypothetical protein